MEGQDVFVTHMNDFDCSLKEKIVYPAGVNVQSLLWNSKIAGVCWVNSLDHEFRMLG